MSLEERESSFLPWKLEMKDSQRKFDFRHVLSHSVSPTLRDSMGCSPPGSSVHGILQLRILEWVAMPSSWGFSQPRGQTQVSRVAGGFFTIWATREAKEYWSG